MEMSVCHLQICPAICYHATPSNCCTSGCFARYICISFPRLWSIYANQNATAANIQEGLTHSTSGLFRHKIAWQSALQIYCKSSLSQQSIVISVTRGTGPPCGLSSNGVKAKGALFTSGFGEIPGLEEWVGRAKIRVENGRRREILSTM